MGVGKFLHVVYKVGTVGKWTSTFLCSQYSSPLLPCHQQYYSENVFTCMFWRSAGFPRLESLTVVPVVVHLSTEDLDLVSLLVLWPNFDEDNITFYPRCLVGLWMKEQDELLSRVLRMCH